MARAFLAACWENLAIISYAVPRELLMPRVPPGCELDEHPDWSGQGLVSLVAFDFSGCRVKGVRWRLPGTRLVDFPEVNLRFYVRGPRGRGVCFVREYVPSRLISVVARAVYNEPYYAARMESRVDRERGIIRVEHEMMVDDPSIPSRLKPTSNRDHRRQRSRRSSRSISGDTASIGVVGPSYMRFGIHLGRRTRCRVHPSISTLRLCTAKRGGI